MLLGLTKHGADLTIASAGLYWQIFPACEAGLAADTRGLLGGEAHSMDKGSVDWNSNFAHGFRLVAVAILS